MRWRVVLPIIGVLLFLGESSESVGMNRKAHTSRYFYWSSIRLDSDPLNRHPRPLKLLPCKDQTENCVGFDSEYIWVDPGWLAKLLILSAFPAFVFGGFAVHGLGRLGISEVRTFMVSMPLMIVTWYYLVGWLVDRWRYKRLREGERLHSG
jgi:hypothetical protein